MTDVAKIQIILEKITYFCAKLHTTERKEWVAYRLFLKIVTLC